MSCMSVPAMQSCDTGQRIPFFEGCQFITTWMSNTKFYTDSIKVCHFAFAIMKGWTYVWTYSVRTIFSELSKISWKLRLPYFLTHGAPLLSNHTFFPCNLEYKTTCIFYWSLFILYEKNRKMTYT